MLFRSMVKNVLIKRKEKLLNVEIVFFIALILNKGIIIFHNTKVSGSFVQSFIAVHSIKKEPGKP